MKKIIGFVVIAIVGVFLVLGILRSQESEEVLSINDIQQRDGIPVFAQPVARHDVRVLRTYYGTIEAKNQSVVTAKLMERAADVHVQEGQWVKKGDALVTFDSTASAAAVSQARLQLENSKRDLNRMKALRDEGAISEQQLDLARLGYEVAEENYRTAHESVSLTAPISGTVARIDIDEGDLANPGDPVVTIINDGAYEVSFEITQEDRPLLQSGQPVKLTLNGETVEGQVTRMSLSASAETRLFTVYASVPVTNSVFPGVLATVEVVVGEADNALAVPSDAILERDGQTFVVVVKDGSTAKMQPVQRGVVGEDLVEILQGLNDGDVVATYGHTALEDGARVKLVDEVASTTSN